MMKFAVIVFALFFCETSSWNAALRKLTKITNIPKPSSSPSSPSSSSSSLVAFLILANGIGIMGMPSPTFAQIPMMEEFNQGSGSKVVTTAKPGVAGGKIIKEDTMQGTVREARKAVDDLKDVVKKEEWESVLVCPIFLSISSISSI